jgi:hypothetical protein
VLQQHAAALKALLLLLVVSPLFDYEEANEERWLSVAHITLLGVLMMAIGHMAYYTCS